MLSPHAHRRNQYLTVSLPSAEELAALGVDRGRIAVVRNGAQPVPDTVVTGAASTRTTYPSIVVLSRLVPHKQIEDALAAVATPAPTRAGSAPRRHRRRMVGARTCRPRRTNSASPTRSPSTGTSTSDASMNCSRGPGCTCMPSRKEGWGLAVIEAAQHGVPTVGYRSSAGLTDSIIDGVTGVLVGRSGRDGDSPPPPAP